MNRFPGLLIEFPQVGQAHAANVQLARSRMPNRKAGDAQMMNTLSIAIQETSSHQVCEEAMDRADRQARQRRHLLGRESVRRLTEQIQQPKPSLQSGYVVVALEMYSHRDE
jgi:tmRNA-binding protein